MQRYHVIAEQCGLCVDVLARQTPLRPAHIHALLQIGAVYTGPTPRNAIRIRPEGNGTTYVRAGDYIRVNSTHPRRYRPRARPRVIAETPDYVVVDKPAGIPCGPTGDNLRDNVLHHLSAAAEDPHYLSLPHRLDADTSGVLVVAKRRAFASHVGSLIQARDPSIVKTYRAIVADANGGEQARALHRRALASTAGTVTLSHHMLFNTHQKVYSTSPFPGALPCTSFLRPRSAPVTRTAAAWVALGDALPRTPGHRRLKQALHWWAACGGAPLDRSLTLWEVDLRLLTGRTHQCRGQLHCEGFHVAGDNTYEGATSSASKDRYRSSPFLALQSAEFAFRALADPSLTECFTVGTCWWEALSQELSNQSQLSFLT